MVWAALLSRVFQSTLPMKGATDDIARYRVGRVVSIHAPNEGSDLVKFYGTHYSARFNPRSQ